MFSGVHTRVVPQVCPLLHLLISGCQSKSLTLSRRRGGPVSEAEAARIGSINVRAPHRSAGSSRGYFLRPPNWYTQILPWKFKRAVPIGHSAGGIALPLAQPRQHREGMLESASGPGDQMSRPSPCGR